jgi:hypothetical protein
MRPSIWSERFWFSPIWRSSRRTHLRRPGGISLLSLLLVFSALAAFVLTLTAEALAELQVKWRLVQFSAFFYGLTAAVAAIGLWRMRRWGYIAFVAWVAAVLLVGSSWPVVFPTSRTPWWVALIWIGFVAALMTPLAGYVKREIVSSLRQ